ncbi:hypothetical protein [Streptomyces sp. NPDC014733]|uniref:hypothetical protein n=1 Tax=Streptomyces sp. NPDC014733 TaxID=3364885 RepID=UPI0036F5F8E9
MSTRHAKPDRMRPPFAGPALVAAGIPAAIVAAHGAPALAGIEQPGAPIEHAAADAAGAVIDRAASPTACAACRPEGQTPHTGRLPSSPVAKGRSVSGA